MPHVQITWVEGRTPEQKRKIAERVTTVLYTCRFTMLRRRVTPKVACWWWTRSARLERVARFTRRYFLRLKSFGWC